MKGMKYTEAAITRVQEFIADPTVSMTQKLDGVRLMIHIDAEGTMKFQGPNDERIKFAAAAQHFTRLEGRMLLAGLRSIVLDGELLIEEGRFIAFDMPYSKRHEVSPATPYRQRIEALRSLEDHVEVVPVAFTELDKARLWDQVKRQNAEGVIVRPNDGEYEVGRRSSRVQKIKVVKTVDVVVTSVNRPDARHGSAGLGAYDDEGVLVSVGACSLIGKPQVAVGDVIEVACLYSTAGLTLYQPRMMRVREDKAATDCTVEQLRSIVTDRRVIPLEEKEDEVSTIDGSVINDGVEWSAGSIDKAERLLEQDKVHADPTAEGVWWVEGSKRYRVQTDGRTWITCTCPSGMKGGRPRCYHTAAVLMRYLEAATTLQEAGK